jgi:hypothetical protein
MRSINIIFTIILFFILLFHSNCNQIKKTEIETIFETEKCIIGAWKNEDTGKKDEVE